MPAGDKLIQCMKQVSKKANPATKNTDVVYGVVKSTSPLTVLVDNRLELTEEFLILSPFCKKAGFNISINSHQHGISVSKVSQENHSHGIADITLKDHKHKLDGKDTSDAGSQTISNLKTKESGGFSIQPTAECGEAGGHKISVTLWGDLEVADKLVMLRVAEGQAYMILYRDRLDIKVSCQDQP
ncbi:MULTISPECIES: DUF2577 family protein [Erysipelotrichaceae]|uniref:DUF2577 family protein n=1 Tax=[Eubacterium] hominis TaxID=2764325 RepID=A0A7G9GNL8_9FIRM|nr:DUF2577 family protein [Absiella sp. AM27-20]QNM12400.1 DUF2577 family protein [[Eubacterium] hominis]RHU10645.1 DUF2577 domain-containing protein [Absiella sp. AM27-20]